MVRLPGPARVVEDEPYPLRVELSSGILPPPGGELIEPLLGWPVPIGGRWSRKVRINVRFSRRGRKQLEPGRLVIRDPLRLHVREVMGDGERGGGGAAARRARDRTGRGWGGIGRALRHRRRPGPGRAPAGRLERRAGDRRPEGLPGGLARVSDPLAHRGATRRDAGAADGGRAGLRSARGARRIRARQRGGARHGRARGGIALRSPGTDVRLRDPAAGRAPPGGDRPRHGRVARGARPACAGGRVPGTRPPAASRREAERCSGSRPPRSGARRAGSSGCPRARATWCPRASCRAAPPAFEVAGCTGYLLGRGARRVAA